MSISRDLIHPSPLTVPVSRSVLVLVLVLLRSGKTDCLQSEHVRTNEG